MPDPHRGLRSRTLTCYNRAMTPLTDNAPARPDARTWSAWLGTLAAENARPHPGFAFRLLTALDNLQQRNRAREDAEAKLRAHLFVLGH